MLDTCSLESLWGPYLYEIHGNEILREGQAAYLEVGLMHFDGDGNGIRIGTDSSSRAESESDITYTVDESCIGEITVADVGTYRGFFSPAGNEVTFPSGTGDIQTGIDGGAELAADADLATCDESALLGTYQYRSRGVFGPDTRIEHGCEVYDGEGNVTNAYRVSGEDETKHLVGTYELGEDCHAVVTYEDGPTLDQYVAPDGEDFYWIQTDGFEEEGLFGGHEHRVSTSTDTALTTEG